jgi:hypothetical protein
MAGMFKHFRFFLQQFLVKTVFNVKKSGIKKFFKIRPHKMKLYKIISGLFIITFFFAPLSAQDNNCNIRKSFPVKTGNILLLSNKYGDVNVITGKEDSLIICSKVTIIQEDKNLQKKSMKMVNINIDKVNDTIYVGTLYDKKFFNEEIREGRTNFSVDYLVKVPDFMNMRIANEFGNVSVEELDGFVNIRLSQGILSIKKLSRGNLKPVNTVYVDHGKVTIDEFNWMTLTLLNCPSVNLGKAKALNLTSSISKIYIEDVSSLVNNSKSDSYSISSVNNMVSESTYSEFEIGNLNNLLKSKITYGSLRVHDVNKDFNGIDITSTQARITVLTGQGKSFLTDINVNDAQVDFPSGKFPQIIKTSANYSTNLIGIAGADKQTKSMIKIKATGGRVTVE